MKLGEAISRIMGTLQRSLLPKLVECRQAPLTEKEQQLVRILELLRIEEFVPRRASDRRMGRKLGEREASARSFVTKAVYGIAVYTSADRSFEDHAFITTDLRVRACIGHPFRVNVLKGIRRICQEQAWRESPRSHGLKTA